MKFIVVLLVFATLLAATLAEKEHSKHAKHHTNKHHSRHHHEKKSHEKSDHRMKSHDKHNRHHYRNEGITTTLPGKTTAATTLRSCVSNHRWNILTVTGTGIPITSHGPEVLETTPVHT